MDSEVSGVAQDAAGTRPEFRVAMIGYRFMGAAHSHAWRTAPRFFDLPLMPRLAVLCGRTRAAAADAAARMGWAAFETDWRRVVERDDVNLVDICTPGETHAEIAIAALEAGKHVLCEKPLANTAAEAARMTVAAERAAAAGRFAMCGFSYRRAPALALARRLVAEGRLGEIRHVRAQYLQDWLSDAQVPLTWRLDRGKAGSGALGDIGAHIADAAQFVTGMQITGVSGVLRTFVTERPLPGERAQPGAATAGQVSVDDAAAFTARFDAGALGVFEATRSGLGRKNALRLEVNGSSGSLAFDFEDMNSLEFFDGTAPAHARGFTRILATDPEHPYVAAWWPPGHGLGYEHCFTHQVVDLVRAIGREEQPRPSFADAYQVQRVIAAVEQSAAAGSAWQPVAPAE
ncbi:MAG: Gfo/Idh/MocA family protein [Streptosporangiaceae bacterium]